jgi:hypothetical protein
MTEFRQKPAPRQSLSLRTRYWPVHAFICVVPQNQLDAKSPRRFWRVAWPAVLLLYGGQHSHRWTKVYEVGNHAPNR